MEQSLHPLLVETFKTQSVYDSKGMKVPLHSNVSAQEAQVLYEAVRAIKPTVSYEVGFAQGCSALAILSALQANGIGHHHIHDPFQENYGDAGLSMVSRAGLSHRMTFHRHFADEIISGLPPAQFAFVDASHLFDWSIAEFVLIDRQLEVGGAIGFHDLWMPSLQKLLRYILTNRHYKLYETPSQKYLPRKSFKSFLGKVLDKLPKSEKIFAPELLHPWESFGIPNLVLVQKTANDDRNWQLHQIF